MEKDITLVQAYEKRYKSAGPLRSNIVNFHIKVKDNLLIDVMLTHTYDSKTETDNVEIDTIVHPQYMFDFYDLVRNDILFNNIDKNELLNWVKKINEYSIWLNTVYKPKWGMMDEFFYQVYLWVREDLKLFANYSGVHLEEIIAYQMDKNWDLINPNEDFNVINKLVN